MKSKKPDDDDRDYVGVTGGVSKRRITREMLAEILRKDAEEDAKELARRSKSIPKAMPEPAPVAPEPPARNVAKTFPPDKATRQAINERITAARAARRKLEAERRAQYKPGFDDLLSFVNRPNVRDVFNQLVRERMPDGVTLSRAATLMGQTTKGSFINTMRGERAWSGQMLKCLIIWLGGTDVEWLVETRKRRRSEALKMKRARHLR